MLLRFITVFLNCRDNLPEIQALLLKAQKQTYHTDVSHKPHTQQKHYLKVCSLPPQQNSAVKYQLKSI